MSTKRLLLTTSIYGGAGLFLAFVVLALTSTSGSYEHDLKHGPDKHNYNEKGVKGGGEEAAMEYSHSFPSAAEGPEVNEEARAGWRGGGIEWEGAGFPQHLQIPGDLGRISILACDEILLDNGVSMRVTVFTSDGDGDGALLFLEMGDGYGGVSKRGVFDPSSVRISHDPSDNSMIYNRLASLGLGDLVMSSTDDARLSVQAPVDPRLIMEFVGGLQERLGSIGQAQLVPLKPEWADLDPSHGDQYVRLQ